MMPRLSRGLLALFLLGLLAASACRAEGAEPPESPPAGWPESLDDFTVTWTAEPGIDLTTGPAVAARAYMESYYLAYLTTDDKYLYPGFAQAVDSNQADGPDGTEKLWPEPYRPKTWIGTARHHILRIDQSGRDVAVVGCVYSYSSAEKTDAGFEANIGGTGPDAGISAIRIGLEAPENSADLPVQEGPSRAPFENVFGGWRVTNHQGGFLATAEWPDHAKDVEQCVAQAPEPPEARTFIPTSPYPRSAFPVLPATPGWPAKPDAPTDQPG
ncbi:membrane protein [Mycolicibacterium smegmatis]|nr:membrane protein [Mycolicibacterium smegmatis]